MLSFQQQQIQDKQDKLDQQGRLDKHDQEYYLLKYERELEQYNRLSAEFRQVEADNSSLLKRNATNAIQIGQLKSEVLLLHQEMEALLRQEEQGADIEQVQSQLRTVQQQRQQGLMEIKQLQDCLCKARMELNACDQDRKTSSCQIRTLEEDSKDLRVQLERETAQLEGGIVQLERARKSAVAY